MPRKILVPWAMPDIGKEVLRKAKVEAIFIHGPKGELPSLKELMEEIKNIDVEHLVMTYTIKWQEVRTQALRHRFNGVSHLNQQTNN